MDRISQIDTFCRYNQVSRETINGLKIFENHLIESNKELNLVGKSTIKDIWHRHFLDSAQVVDLIEKNSKIIVDIGSGAGFPGLVVSIILKDRNIPVKTILIEKSPKKTKFLRLLIKKLSLNVEVLNENVFEKTKKFSDNVFLIRAFKPLKIILELIHNKAQNWHKIFIFMGKTGNDELIQASKVWDIEYKQRVSLTSNDSKILEINQLKKKN